VLVPQLHHDLGLSVKPGDALLPFTKLGAEELDRSNLVEEDVAGLVDLGHSAFAEKLQDHVLPEPFPDERVYSLVVRVLVH